MNKKINVYNTLSYLQNNEIDIIISDIIHYVRECIEPSV